MKRLQRTAAAACLAAIAWPFAASAADSSMEMRSYVSFRFGGDAAATGLRLGLAATDVALHDALPALAQVEVSANGLLAAVGGMPLARTQLKLSQAEEAVAEEGLFGSGALLGWGAAALGAGALYGIFVLAEEDDDADPLTPGAPPQSSSCPLPVDPMGLCSMIVEEVEGIVDQLPPPPGGLGLSSARFDSLMAARDLEREAWLDSGTGQMGDLVAR